MNPSLLRIRLKYSKTDQLGSRLDIVLGRTYQDICPVVAAMAYLAVRRHGEGPLFKFADGRYLTKEHFTHRIREALVALGLHSEDYAGHSFRIGAATMAVQIGLEDSTFRTLGRWKSDTYLRTTPERSFSLYFQISDIPAAIKMICRHYCFFILDIYLHTVILATQHLFAYCHVAHQAFCRHVE